MKFTFPQKKRASLKVVASNVVLGPPERKAPPSSSHSSSVWVHRRRRWGRGGRIYDRPPKEAPFISSCLHSLVSSCLTMMEPPDILSGWQPVTSNFSFSNIGNIDWGSILPIENDSIVIVSICIELRRNISNAAKIGVLYVAIKASK